MVESIAAFTWGAIILLFCAIFWRVVMLLREAVMDARYRASKRASPKQTTGDGDD